MFEMLEKREGKHLFNHGRLVFLNMIVHLITMWIDFFFSQTKRGNVQKYIKLSQSQFFGPSQQVTRSCDH